MADETSDVAMSVVSVAEVVLVVVTSGFVIEVVVASGTRPPVSGATA